MKPQLMVWAIVVAGLVVVDRNAARAANGANDAAVVEAYALSYVSADECAKVIREIFVADDLAGSAVDVVSDRRSNSLLVAGSREMQARVSRVLADLDVKAGRPSRVKVEPAPLARRATPQKSKLQSRVIKLQHVDCEEVAERIRVLFHGGDGVEKVSWFKPGNAILLRSTAEELEQVEEIISQIDVPPARSALDKPEPAPAIFHLEYADAKDMAEMLRSYLGHGRASRRRTALTRVIVDERLNCVVVRGDSLEVAEAMALVSKLDVPLHPDGQTQARNTSRE